jgi:hypothetical protein
VSRGEANISKHIPHAVIKSLDIDSNNEEIDTYVRQYIKKYNTIQMHFDIEKKDPIEFFHKHANGIFLWVTIVLYQLRQTKQNKMFKKYLNGFTDTSGDMEKLYSSVLSRFEGSV